jgi:hypothetical protein
MMVATMPPTLAFNRAVAALLAVMAESDPSHAEELNKVAGERLLAAIGERGGLVGDQVRADIYRGVAAEVMERALDVAGQATKKAILAASPSAAPAVDAELADIREDAAIAIAKIGRKKRAK